MVLAILDEADWAIPVPDERPRTHYQTQGELRIPAWMVSYGYKVADSTETSAADIHRRINDVLCWAIDDALGDGQQDGPG